MLGSGEWPGLRSWGALSACAVCGAAQVVPTGLCSWCPARAGTSLRRLVASGAVSTEQILGIFLPIAGLVLAVAIPVWQIRHGDQRKKSLPPRVEVTYFVLKALVAESRSPSPGQERGSPNNGLPYERLFERVVDDCNAYSPDGNFDPRRKNKHLHSYVRDSLDRLGGSTTRFLEPLVGGHDAVHAVTSHGVRVWDELPHEGHSARAGKLDEILGGSLAARTAQPSEPADGAAATQEVKRPRTHREWRFAVFMAAPEGEACERGEFERRTADHLVAGGLRIAADKLSQAVTWNLNRGNLSVDDAGRIRVAVSKTGKSLDDFGRW